jgi:hypothetical protein
LMPRLSISIYATPKMSNFSRGAFLIRKSAKVTTDDFATGTARMTWANKIKWDLRKINQSAEDGTHETVEALRWVDCYSPLLRVSIIILLFFVMSNNCNCWLTWRMSHSKSQEDDAWDEIYCRALLLHWSDWQANYTKLSLILITRYEPCFSFHHLIKTAI